MSLIIQIRGETCMSEVYRLATPEDAERLLHVIYEAYETIRELELHWPAANADLALIQDNIAMNECYVLELDGEIVATLTLSKEKLNRWNTDLPFLKWFAVDPKYQGIGIGTKLLTWVEEAVIRDKLGAPAVTLATAEKHPWLLPMYERKGYVRIESVDRGNGDGTMHLLRKIVNPALYEAQLRGKAEQAGLHR
jgi:GNAT superfamily N-acetyltransferase